MEVDIYMTNQHLASNSEAEWFTLDDIELLSQEESTDKLYCISVDAPEKQFLIGELGVPTHNTDEAKAADELKGEAIMIILWLFAMILQ